MNFTNIPIPVVSRLVRLQGIFLAIIFIFLLTKCSCDSRVGLSNFSFNTDPKVTTTTTPPSNTNSTDDEDEDIKPAKLITDVIDPSDTCKAIVDQFASAISNFTFCSVANSRPIHLCTWCVGQYLQIIKTYHTFLNTIDESGNECQEYFTNLDRVEIVSGAYQYVKALWNKGHCDSCFLKFPNGTIQERVTEDTSQFETLYELTHSCFNAHKKTNDTCEQCFSEYRELNDLYVQIEEINGVDMCLDVVDTMNITREIWSVTFQCLPRRVDEFWLHFSMGFVAIAPLAFYVLAFVLSGKQEARVLQQSRLVENFAVNSTFTEETEDDRTASERLLVRSKSLQ